MSRIDTITNRKMIDILYGEIKSLGINEIEIIEEFDLKNKSSKYHVGLKTGKQSFDNDVELFKFLFGMVVELRIKKIHQNQAVCNDEAKS